MPPLVVDDICRLCNLLANGGTLLALEEGERCGRYEGGEDVHVAALYCAADGGGADRCAADLSAWDDAAFDVRLWQLCLHDFIVEARDAAGVL